MIGAFCLKLKKKTFSQKLEKKENNCDDDDVHDINLFDENYT